MSLDAVVARSRIAGGFSQHRRFTIAKNRAIEKMRRFALPDPHDYVLEFVQAALANGARHISMSLEREQCMISYIGGGLREHELANLFDFLFASKDRTDIEHVRALALGINAALNFAPKQVVIESGDGTPSGTSRMVLDPVNNRVDVGKADKPLAGSFIALRGIDRKALRHPVAWSGRAPEAGRLEERCLCAPIPIVVDGVPLFGYSSQRTPALFGYQRVLSFDEGEMYGTIGINPSFPEHAFTLLTRGVSIQTRAHDLVLGQRIGGVVCFDRLRKTVDHSAIVDDERLGELWLRLRHHAETLIHGKPRASSQVHLLDGRELPGRELCELLRTAERAVLVDPDAARDPAAQHRAAAIGASLGAPVLVVGAAHRDWLHALSGRRIQLVRARLDTDADVRFFAQPPAETPKTGLATSPIELPPVEIAALVADIAFDDDERTYVREILGDASASLSVHLLEDAPDPTGVELQIWIADRIAWRGRFPSERPAHVIVMKLPGADRHALTDDDDAPALRSRLAGAASARTAKALALACSRALADRRTVVPRSEKASIALAAAIRSIVAWMRPHGGAFALELLQLDAEMPELRTLPLLADHTGAPIDLETLQTRAASGCGMVLGAAAVPAGFDPRAVVRTSPRIDRILDAWLGPNGYARVDGPSWSTRIDALECRVPWLRTTVRYDAPWLPADGETQLVGVAERRRVATSLIEDLVAAIASGDASAAVTLQWCAAQSLADREVVDLFADLPAFVAENGERARLRDVWIAATDRALRVAFARQVPAPALLVPTSQPTAIGALACSPIVARALARSLRVQPSVEIEVDVRDDPSAQSLLAWVDVDDDVVFGRVCLRGGPTVGIAVIDTEGRPSVDARALAWEVGAQGVLRLRKADVDAGLVLARIRDAIGTMFERLRERVANNELDGEQRELALGRLLGRATRSVRMQWQIDGTLVPFVDDAAAAAMLHLPVLESRALGPVGLWWAIVRFGQLVACGETTPVERLFAELASPPTDVLASWLRKWSVPARPQPAVIADDRAPLADASERLRRALEHWLARLRADTMLTEPARVELELRGQMGALLEGVTTRVVVNVEHPTIAPALARPDDGEALAWALLAIYAEINAVLDPVLNVHELAFQQRVVDALLAGELHG